MDFGILLQGSNICEAECVKLGLTDMAFMKKKLPYRLLWQALLLNRKTRKEAIPIDISLFKTIKSNIGLHGYRRVRKEDREDVRAYRKDTYGTTILYVNLKDSSIEGITETWSGLMGICSEFGLRAYRAV